MMSNMTLTSKIEMSQPLWIYIDNISNKIDLNRISYNMKTKALS